MVQFTLDERRLGGSQHEQLATVTQDLGRLMNGGVEDSRYYRVHLHERTTRLTLSRSQFHIVRKYNAPKEGSQ
jgi:hypothetical protein